MKKVENLYIEGTIEGNFKEWQILVEHKQYQKQQKVYKN